MTDELLGPAHQTADDGRVNSGIAGVRSVLHLNEKGGRFGGTEEYIALLTAGLAAGGVDSHLACGLVGGDLPAELRSVHVIDGLASRTPVGGTADAVVALVERLRPDIVYLHNIFDPAVVIAVAELDDRGTLLWYVHDHFLTCLTELRWRHDVGSCPVRLGLGCVDLIAAGECVVRHPPRTFSADDVDGRVALAATLSLVDAVIVVSASMRDLLEAANDGIGTRLHHLDRPVRRSATAVRLGRSDDERVVVTYAGRINPEKGLDVVLAALAEMTSPAATAALVELRIAGVVEAPAYWDECRAIADRATATNPGLTVAVVGHLDYAAMDAELRDADIVVVPSQWPEPLGAVAAEALAAGVPVIASDIGGLSELVHDGVNGLLVPAGDVAAWARAIDRLATDPAERTRMGRRGRDDMSQRTVDRHIADLVRLATASHD